VEIPGLADPIDAFLAWPNLAVSSRRSTQRPAACSKRSAPNGRSIGSAPASSNVPPEDEVAKFREKYGGDPDVVEQRDLALRCRQPKRACCTCST